MIYFILLYSIKPGSDLNFIIIEVCTLLPHDRRLLLHVFGLMAACQVYEFNGRDHFQRSHSMWMNNIFALKAIISRCNLYQHSNLPIWDFFVELSIVTEVPKERVASLFSVLPKRQ
jgi:hypothetical protein